ncbi:MAG TPA: prolyl aminopeptidase [Propionibacteriaceae bacterium]|nr:prolyl aminopeptidase [Propionibacteriaceae bacterium]
MTDPHDPAGTEAALYPPIEPYESGMLDVGDGHHLYWEQCGRPDGKPVVVLHGGPGGGCSAMMRRYFDPEKYRVILFDQRMCGRSTPHASQPDADLSANTTWHLVADIETLRTSLGIESWQVWGGSWGSALALAYAETHPDRVTELVLRGIFMLRRWELDWFYNGPAGLIRPDWWPVFEEPLRGEARSHLHIGTPGNDNISRYHELLFNPDPAVHVPAGVAWTTWENATAKLLTDPGFVEAGKDPAYAVAFARIENHYFTHAGFFRPDQLLEDVGRIRHIPTVIVHGQYDMCCPVRNAYDLAAVWPEADLRVVLAGHASTEPAIAAELVAATDRFAAVNATNARAPLGSPA